MFPLADDSDSDEDEQPDGDEDPTVVDMENGNLLAMIMVKVIVIRHVDGFDAANGDEPTLTTKLDGIFSESFQSDVSFSKDKRSRFVF